ncbi:Membrane bound O-acyl transferase, MBOAT [Metarhizium album ARSEF 1941]|uniref:Membrane bound O-acyl transferase, MBOAT n=1 Tax=Metarhizium album (strain ARSEF 1941) TaxID=1081103 RepID=A0A0B2WWG4_METAS|nr:Membrane bound O-acyl transferase, MBOAT [Metarhizium album ARSEF 1941]KHN97215.1 Membrane bound O-acyl transferase, MBOAT [Metarhizium album ARSEF 1941]
MFRPVAARLRKLTLLRRRTDVPPTGQRVATGGIWRPACGSLQCKKPEASEVDEGERHQARSMMSTSAPVTANGLDRDRDHGHILRPRKRKGIRTRAVRTVSSESDSHIGVVSESAPASGLTSGRATPIPENAPPSAKSLSSARKLVRAEQKRRLFPTIEYASRVSHFDPESDYRDFHGFFNLFWIGLAIMGITTMLRNMRDTGYPLRIQIWSLFTVKLWHLAVADLLMVATSLVGLPLHRVFRRAPMRAALTWAKAGMAIQSAYQALWLTLWIAVPFVLEWTWTAQVFLLLHTMVMLMKMHSYAFYNGHLSETEKRLRSLDSPGDSADTRPAYVYPPANLRRGSISGIPTTKTPSSPDTERPPQPADKHAPPSPATSPDSSLDIGTLREALARELTSPMGNTTYPHNLTWANYIDYLFCPTLCYELEYPRTPSVNWTSLIAKTVATFGCIFLLTVTSEEFILPVLVDAQRRLNASSPPSTPEALLILAESISWLLFPFMLTFLLVFLVIFEYVLGAFAEITRFADRHFYADWWNSTDWMEFSREWNVPVYSFLRRHVYSASRPHTGKMLATLITFLISAAMHEVVMACISKKIRGYGFICQMLQLPIVMLQRTRLIRGRQTLNNVCFWCSMILGLSLVRPPSPLPAVRARCPRSRFTANSSLSSGRFVPSTSLYNLDLVFSSRKRPAHLPATVVCTAMRAVSAI